MDNKTLFDKTGLKISAIAEDLNLSENYLRNIRRGKDPMTDRLREYLVIARAQRDERKGG